MMSYAAAAEEDAADDGVEINDVESNNDAPTSTTTPGPFFSAAEQEEVATTYSSSSPTKFYHRTWFRILIVLLLIGAAVGLALGLTLGRQSNDAATTAPESNEQSNGGAEDEEGVIYLPGENENEGGSPTPTVSPREGVEVGAEGNDEPTISPREFEPTPYPTTPYPTYTGFGGFDNPGESLGSLYEDDGTCTPPTTDMTSVINTRDTNSCTYQNRQTVSVSAPSPSDSTIEKKLSGGTSAYDGNNAVIVSYNSDGSAGAVWALSKRSGEEDGIWEQSAILQTSDSDQLGWSVSIKGDTFVVGAPGFEGSDIPLVTSWYWAGRGKAMVMTRDEESGEWSEEGVLLPSVADDNSDFGSTVDIAECECLIAVGAWHDRFSKGSIFIFEKDSEGEWTEIQKLAPDDTRRTQSDHLHGNYGYTVAINDEVLAVKAPYDSYIGSYDYYDPNRGVVYIYKRGSDGLYEEAQRLCTPEGTQVRAHLKDLLFLDGFLLVGAPGLNKVYVYEQRDDGTYERSAELTPSDGTTEESNFGIRLDGKGTDVLVGDLGSEASYLFTYEDGVWKEKVKFNGVTTSLSGDSIVEHKPKSFAVNGEQYGGDVNFLDLVCE